MTYIYKPVQFFLIVFLGSWIPGFIAAYFSNQKGMEKLYLLIIPFLLVPLIATLFMIYSSGNQELIGDFWHRVALFRIKPSSLLLIFFLMPCVIFLATALSLLFGRSSDQFALASEYSVMKGWHILGVLIPFLLAPLLEELGWRGYGVDSLRAYHNLFITSLLFGALWAVWHLPAFFIKGSYHNELWNLGGVYALNFFVSILPIAILTNWVYYANNRSIPAAILFHSMLNISSIVFKTEQFTKCIATILLCIVATLLILKNRSLFFHATI